MFHSADKYMGDILHRPPWRINYHPVRISHEIAANRLDYVRPERLVPERTAMDPVDSQLAEHWSHSGGDVWKQQQARSTFELVVGEQRRQTRVEDPVGRLDPLVPGDVSRLVASSLPHFRFERNELVRPADKDDAGGRWQMMTVPT